MRQDATIVPGSWWFGRGWLPWPTAAAESVDVGRGLSLHPAAGGASDPALAADGGTLWLAGPRLRRFDAITGRFRDVPGPPLGPGTGIAATRGLLAIADPARHEVIVLAAGTLTVRERLPLGRRRPVSVAGHDGRLLVLDDHGTVRESTPALDRLVPLSRPSPPAGTTWVRIAVDRDGRVHLLDSRGEGRFPAPPFTVDHRGRFQVPGRFRIGGADDPAWFDRSGEPTTVAPDESPGPRRFATRGTWTSKPLDSRTLGCRWHRTVLTGVVPPGCGITLRTYASDDTFDAGALADGSWSRPHRIAGAAQPATPADSDVDNDYAVLAERGRFLAIRLELTGHGWATPTVAELLTEPQAPGLERFLPAIYRGDEQNTDFLRRFLAIFSAELDGLDHRLRMLPRRFSPAAVPDPWVNSLAAELGVPLEREWTADQRRVMLDAAPRLYPRRGTPAAIRAILRAHLEAALGRPVPEHVPALVEGFRERPGALLGSARLPAGAGTGLWSGSVVDRPRLGTPGRHDRIHLVSVGDRRTDRFRVHANRFSVVVPRSYLPDSDARARFERLIVAEKPAHIAHQIVTVEPRTVLDDQCRLGVDAYLGAVPPARLADSDRAGPPLGTGLRLGGRGSVRDRPPALGRGGHVGVQTVLI